MRGEHWHSRRNVEVLGKRSGSYKARVVHFGSSAGLAQERSSRLDRGTGGSDFDRWCRVSELVPIQFHGDTLYTVVIDGKPHVVLHPAFGAIGVNADRQIANLHKQPWATTAVTAVVAGDGKLRNMIAADVRSFLMALATIPVSRVAEHVRPKLIDYQREVADVIEAHFSQPHHHVTTPNTVTWDELSALMRQRYGIDLDAADITRALREGGVLKQTGAPKKPYRNWFWFTGSAWTVHPHILPELTRKVVNTRKAIGDLQAIQMELAMDSEFAAALEECA